MTSLILAANTLLFTIDVIDSKDEPDKVFIIYNDTCKIKVGRIQLEIDQDTVVALVMEKCGL